jgi:hypothetical protein
VKTILLKNTDQPMEVNRPDGGHAATSRFS